MNTKAKESKMRYRNLSLAFVLVAGLPMAGCNNMLTMAQDAEMVENVKAALSVTSLSGDLSQGVTGDLELPTKVEGATIAWSSSPEGYVDTNTGEVTQPAFGSEDVTVTLTATITKGTIRETKTYEVTIKASSVAMSSFSFSGFDATASIDGKTVAITLPFGTAVTKLVAEFTVAASADWSMKIGEAEQTSGATPNDFTAPLTYVLTGSDGSTARYTVTVTIAKSDEKTITAFSFADPAATGTITGTAIAVEVPYGTDVTALVASFTVAGTSVNVDGVAQASGKTANDFTKPLTYRVTAADGSTAEYTVTLTFAPNTAHEITAFCFSGYESGTDQGEVNAVIGTNTIAVTVPYGTDLKALKATFAISADAVIAIGATTQTSGETVVDFTSPVTYTLSAANGDTGNYTVTVTAREPYAYTLTDGVATITALSSEWTAAAGTEKSALSIPATIDGYAVKAIGMSAFQSNYLTSVTMPESVTSIGASAFADCSGLSSITIPSAVTSIGENAFADCAYLKEVFVRPTSPPTLGASAFASCAETLFIRVYQQSLDTYKTAAGWSSYADILDVFTSNQVITIQ